MPNQPESVIAAQDMGGAQPIVDDPKVLDRIYEDAGVNAPEHEPEDKTQPWEKAIADLAEGQKGLQDTITQLAEAVSQGYGRQPTERVIEREVQRLEPATQPKWRQGLKDEQAELLQAAIRDTVGGILGEYEQRQLAPTLGYLLRGQEELLEGKLITDYPDEDFGYSALAAEAKAYRQALNNQIDLRTAYKHIAFEKTNQALRKVREDTLAAARKTKAENPMSDSTTGRTNVDEGVDVAFDEMRAARSFFGGTGRDGKSRSDAEIRAMWLAHKKGAERDKNPFLDVDTEPEFKRR